MGSFLGMFKGIWDFLVLVVISVLEAALEDDAHLELLPYYILVVTIVLGSGAWSSSIAESRLRSPKLHFFIGLLLPVVYPLVILFAMQPPAPPGAEFSEEPEVPAAGAPAGTAPPLETAAPAAPAPEETPAIGIEADEDEEAFTPAYFRRIARDDEGNFTGPWKLVVEGNEIIARRILEPLPKVLVIETVARGGKTQRLRVPYDRIESCVRV